MSINKNDKYGVTVNDARKLADLASQISISGSKQASGNNRELKERQIKEVLAYPNANTPAL
ncbi:hypothetical protein [Chryseobacterium elymi]|uniref:hypothetical protein n=1 Tax=Chryseobacterium elymi TaxID=395936 RepID=UPI000F4D8D87|nr:hypothetical protein [Chryseobacterium elymi]